MEVPYCRYRKMKSKIFLIFLFAFLLVIPTVLAVKVDYSPNDKGVENMKAHIKDTILFGLFKVGEQGTLELKSHQSPTEVKDICINEINWKGEVTSCAVSMVYETNFGELHSGALDDVTFINMRNGNEVQREYRFVYLTTEDKTRDVCVKYENVTNSTNYTKDINSTNETEIYPECIEWTTENYTQEVWKPYNSRDIPKGQITLGIEVQSKIDDYVDGIWNVQGKTLDKHAEWTASLNTDLVSYYKLDETTGDVVDSHGTNDGTNNGA